MTNYWTEDEDRLLASLRKEGLSAAAIGRKLRRSRNSVISRMHRGTKFPYLARQYAAVREETARRRTERLRHELDALNRLKARLIADYDRDEAILHAVLGGARMESIGDMLGVTKQRVSQILARARVPSCANQKT